jgi:hypothetical protein
VKSENYFHFVGNQRHQLTPAESEDLAFNVPGAALRLKSSEIRDSAPARVLMGRVLGVHNSERAWRRGAAGEEDIGRRLSKLGENWRVLHGIPLGKNDTDIDHLVIGPTGVFTLNTKNHLGKRVTVYEYAIYVSGTKQPYLVKSRAEGKRSSRILSNACGFDVNVLPMLVIMANELDFKGSPKDIEVVGREILVRSIERRATQLSSEEIESIYAIARRRSTWLI